MRRQPFISLASVLDTGVRRSLIPIVNSLDGSFRGPLAEGVIGDICHEALA
jgi:hypothetical protein